MQNDILASLHSLHLLRQTDLQSIISSLHQNRQLRLALSLLKNSSSSISPDELERYKLRINQMQAYESFCNQDRVSTRPRKIFEIFYS